MSLGECGERNPLVRDGTAQSARAAPALHPRRARVDERGIADLLLLTGRYATGVQFWDAQNRPDGDFAAFVQQDGCYLIAAIGAHDRAPLRECWSAAQAFVGSADATAIADAGALNLLFNLLFNEMATINRWLVTARAGLGVHASLSRQISSALRPALDAALQSHAALVSENLLVPGTPVADTLCAPGAVTGEEWRATEFEGVWFGAGEAPRVLGDAAAAATPGTLEGEDGLARARNAATGLEPALETLLRAGTQLAAEAPSWMQEALGLQPDHAPQMALWLGFARVFRYAQAVLNRSTRRHLDFYYRRVLGLAPHGPTGDRAHLVFALARHAGPQQLPAGTELRAGKDAQGVELRYRLTADAALNHAALAEAGDVRTLYFDWQDAGRPYAAPAAASADGQGGAFADDAEPRWRPFGQSQRSGAGFLPAAQRTMVLAETGFAVSSPELLLREGTRTITVRLTPAIVPDDPALAAGQLRVRWTGEEGWVEAEVDGLLGQTPRLLALEGTGADARLVLELVLGPDAPALAAYDVKLHGDGYATVYPVIEVRLTNREDVDSGAWERLGGIELTALELTVDAEGLRDLQLQNDAGVLDPAKPFAPFGFQPLTGSRFLLGSAETFRKRLQSLRLRWSWQAPPQADLGALLAGYYSTTIANGAFVATWDVLDGGQWRPGGGAGEVTLFDASDAGAGRDAALPVSGLALTADRAARWREPAPGGFGADSAWGFLRLRLALAASAQPASGTAAPDLFGHLRFPRLYAEAAMRYAKGETTTLALPATPWTPHVESLTLGYQSKVTIDLTAPAAGPDTFWHLYPYGQRPAGARDGVTALLPRFVHDEDAGQASAGELYLGLSGLKPRQNLSLLVQVAEGSADPEVPRPAVHWWYWGGDAWTRFGARQVLRDDTAGLTRSGLLIFDVPSAARDAPGLLPAGRHWLRASVGGDPRGVCDLLAVHPQAAQAELVEPAAHPAHLALPLPSGSIAALVDRRAAIKNVSQPYASFGARQAERNDAFDTRVSERLRHKDRAVAPWDYEHLVLEAFPSLYKVKCINHSTYAWQEGGLSIRQSEFAPGWVTVVVVPDLRNRNAVDPLEPRASLAVLEAVRAFLAERMSPWAARRLRVINPLYERLAVRCKVAFVSGADFQIHRARLAEDFTRFLSPWAFPEQGGADISFGGTVHRSSLLHFVEKRDYVDFVTDFEMLHAAGDTPATPVERTAPQSARSVFASVAATDHDIGEASC